jgi:preprotein translocase subunit SecG
MNVWLTIVLVVHVAAALGIIGLVLLQHGKGADVGAAFGSGASGSLFGATGSANFLSRTTGVLAVVFFCTSLALAYLATNRQHAGGTVMDTMPSSSSAPANTAPPSGKPAEPGSKANEVPK